MRDRFTQTCTPYRKKRRTARRKTWKKKDRFYTALRKKKQNASDQYASTSTKVIARRKTAWFCSVNWLEWQSSRSTPYLFRQRSTPSSAILVLLWAQKCSVRAAKRYMLMYLAEPFHPDMKSNLVRRRRKDLKTLRFLSGNEGEHLWV